MSESIVIAGPGRVGQALGRALREAGLPIAAVAGRTPAHAAPAADFIGGAQPIAYEAVPQLATHLLIAVPDDAIASLAALLARAGMRGGVALHTSGAHGPEILAPLARAGTACGALHPLQTIADPQTGARALPHSAFAIDGPPAAQTWALQLVALLAGTPLQIPAAKRLVYHAAAVMASNYLIATLAAAVMLMKEAGVDESTALRALEPLARTSLENAFRLSPPAALTGPVVRGDAGTIRGHLQVLAQAPDTVAGLYRAAGLMALDIARQRGLPPEPAAAVDELLRKG